MPEQLIDLSNKEIEDLQEFYTDEEKLHMMELLRKGNELLESKIHEKQKAIEKEQILTSILLKRLWKNFTVEEKKEGAVFFKETYQRINKE